MDTKPITPGSALLWAFVACVIAIMGNALGHMFGLSTESEWVLTAKGLIVMLISGLAGSVIAGWFCKAFRGR